MIGAIVILETETAGADAHAPPTIAAADPVAMTLTPMPIHPAEAAVIASVRIAIPDVIGGTVMTETGIATGGAAGVGGTTTAAIAARSGITSMTAVGRAVIVTATTTGTGIAVAA
jgi:hypothetical protein